jgi:transcriptional regulator with XRE-family HTH domain
MTLNEKLVILRKKAGMTQEELAGALEVSRQSVHKWESGQCYPEVPKLIAMKAIFMTSIDDMLDDTVEIEMPEKKRSRRVKEEQKTETPAPVSISEEKSEPEAVAYEPEEAKTEQIDLVVIEEAKEIQEEKPEVEKKKGFFSKLFGKK